MKTSSRGSSATPKRTATNKKTTTNRRTTKSPTRSNSTSRTNNSNRTSDRLKLSNEITSASASSSGRSLPNLGAWAGNSNSNSTAASSNSLNLDGQNLRQGSKNPTQVKQLQKMLKDRGAEISVDGKFGPQTRQAVQAFQQQNGLSVDGVVGSQTMGALNGNSGGAQQTNGAQQSPGVTQNSGPQPAGSAARGREVRGGRASMKSGHLQLKDPKTGKVLGTYKFNNGGGGRGAIPWGDYEVSNGRRRSDKSTMKSGGFGYSFDLTQKGQPHGQAKDPRFSSNRTLLRIHPDGGRAGTIGCIGIEGGRKVQEDFYRNAQKLAKENGGKFNLSFRPEGYKGEGQLQNGSGDQVKPTGNTGSTQRPDSTGRSKPSLSLGRGETLRKGRGGHPTKIRQLQQMLNDRGGNLKTDGVFGPRTERALRKFQQENNIGVDGIVGPETLGAFQGGQGTQSNQGPAPVGGLDGKNGLSGRLPQPMKNLAEHFEAAGKKYNVDPRFLAAISMLETAKGKSSAFRNKKNAMGVSNKHGPIRFNNHSESIYRMARVLASKTGPYKNANTINSIGRIYAPPGAGNDVHGTNGYWATGVSKFYKMLGGDPSAAVLQR